MRQKIEEIGNSLFKLLNKLMALYQDKCEYESHVLP